MPFPVATSLNLVFDPDYSVPVTEQLDAVKAGGFRYIDFNFLDWYFHKDNSPFLADNWQDWVMQIKEYGDRNGIVFHQAHAPMFSYTPENSQLDFDYEFDQMTLRSIQAAGMLGIQWIVIHAGHYPFQFYDKSKRVKLREANLAWFDQFVNEGQKCNVGIAIENMANVFALKMEGCQNERYCADLEDLLDLVDSFNTKSVGVCWDTGHGNLQGVDQSHSLQIIGDRLKALHIADNNQLSDEHLAPFFGNIQWEPIIQTLNEINYQGAFTFETHNHVRPFPKELKGECIKQLYNIGNYLVNLK